MAPVRVEPFKVVSIVYSISDGGGEVMEQVDSPVSYVHGVPNNLWDKIEQALDGKQVGDNVEVTLSPEESFGHPDPELLFTDDADNVPLQYRFVGARPVFENEHGETREMVVTRIEDGKLTIDGNHPFAGKSVTFAVTVVDIRDAAEQEIGCGEVMRVMGGHNTLQ